MSVIFCNNSAFNLFNYSFLFLLCLPFAKFEIQFRVNWLNEFSSGASQQMTFSSPEYRWTTSLNKLDPSLCYVSSHFLFDSSVFSHWYFIVPLRDTRLTILTSKELRYKLLTFTIFIIQSQVGAIPVISRLFVLPYPPSLIARHVSWAPNDCLILATKRTWIGLKPEIVFVIPKM